MSRSSAVRAALILLFGFGIVVAAQPIGAGDAEAKRGLTRAAAGGVSAYRALNRENQSEESGEQANQADGETPEAENADTPSADTATHAEPKPEDADAGQPSTAATVRTVTPAAAARPVILKSLEAEVPGCAAGMICTVCVAGCTGPTNSIIHAAPRSTR